MDNSLVNPIQAEDSDVRVDTRPRRFYPNEDCQNIVFPDGTKIPLEFDGVLPYIQIRRPTSEEIQYCRRVSLTTQNEWNPHRYNGLISMVDAQCELEHEHMSCSLDPISTFLNYNHIASAFDDISTFPGIGFMGEDFYNISALQTKTSNSLQPGDLAKLWNIGLGTAKRTLQVTTHKIYRTTGLLSRCFKTDVAQLRYKQMNKQFGTFYSDYLKSTVKSVRGFIGGTVYTNKTGFKKFFPSC